MNRRTQSSAVADTIPEREPIVALVVRTVDFTNTSQVLLLLTPGGFVSAMAKGSRRKGSPFGGPISELGLLECTLKVPREREGLFGLLSGRLTWWPRAPRRSLAAFYASELMREALMALPVPEGDAVAVLDLTLVSLRLMDEGVDPEQAACTFMASMLLLYGLQPELHQCVVTQRVASGKNPVAFSYSEFGILAPTAAAGKAGLDQISPEALGILRALFSGSNESVAEHAAASKSAWLIALRVCGRLLGIAAGRELRSLGVLARESKAAA